MSIPSSSPVVTSRSASQEQCSPLRKRRIVRRRGKKNSVGSEDEIERELVTDSASEAEESSIDSASDSESEPASEDALPNGLSRAFTPNTSQSSDRDLNNKETSGVSEPFFTPAENWSEMVNTDVVGETADLPVIDFANFDETGATPTIRPGKSKKSARGSRSVSAPTAPYPSQPSDGERPITQNGSKQVQSKSQRSLTFSRPPGQSARQAYQQRLESDPSYVPTVGGFWGHDDRLLDKELRSLSGWWRGRWQGRGRGGGFMRGRRRGGFYASPGSRSNPDFDGKPEGLPNNGVEVSAVDRKWSHDGFEEMKDREEQRRYQRAQTQSHSSRGSGKFSAGTLNRGNRPGLKRGRPGRGRRSSSTRASERIWYQMKPEQMWTKQNSGYLHFELDPNLKPRQGQGFGIQIKLPGQLAKIVRTSSRSWRTTSKTRVPNSSTVTCPDLEEKTYTVCLPEVLRESEMDIAIKKDNTSVEAVDYNIRVSSDTFSSRKPEHSSISSQISTLTSKPPDSFVLSALVSQFQNSVETVSKPSSEPGASVSDAVLKQSAFVDELSVPTLPDSDQVALPPLALQPSYTPPLSQASPVYGSTYGFVTALPPGIVMNQHGVPYELATGRPVFIPPPPPSAMYNPRPIVHSHMPSSSVHFLPNHANHHPTVSPDFLSHSASHTPINGLVDSSTGIPMFSLPQPTNRIKISAPSDSSVTSKSLGKTSSSSISGPGLRKNAPSFQPSRSEAEPTLNSAFVSEASTSASTPPIYAPLDGVTDGNGHPPREAIMTYQYPQQQHYFYPDPYYNPYLDVMQVGQYEIYAAEGYNSSHGAVYY